MLNMTEEAKQPPADADVPKMATTIVPVTETASTPSLSTEREGKEVGRTVYYKRVEHTEGDGSAWSLEIGIRAALGVCPNWVQRRVILRENPIEVLVLQDTQTDVEGILIGRLVLYNYETAVEAGILDENTATIQSELVDPVGHVHKRYSFGTLHFAVSGNNVAFIPSKSVRLNLFYKFLNEWLSRVAGTTGVRRGINLVDVVPQHLLKDIANVRKVVFRAALRPETLEDPGDDELLQHLLLTATERLSATAKIPFRQNKKGKQTKGVKAALVLNRVGRTAKDEEAFLDQVAQIVVAAAKGDVPFEIRYGKNNRITNQDVRIAEPIQLPALKGHPIFKETAIRLANWLRQGLQDGRIPPNIN